MPIWKAWRIVHDLERLDRVEVLLDSAGSLISLKNKALSLADSTIKYQNEAYQAKDNEAKQCRLYAEKSEALQKVEIRRLQKKSNKKMIGGFIAGVILALLI